MVSVLYIAGRSAAYNQNNHMAGRPCAKNTPRGYHNLIKRKSPGGFKARRGYGDSMAQEKKGPSDTRPAGTSGSTPELDPQKFLKGQLELDRRIQHAIGSLPGFIKAASESKSGLSSNPPDPRTKTAESRTAQRRGPRPNMNLHQAIAQIVKPYGPNWRDGSNLEKILDQLDKTPATLPSKQWATASPP